MDRKNVTASAVPEWFLILVSVPIIVGFLWFGRGFLTPLAITGLVFILSSAMVDRLCSVSVAGMSLPRWLATLIAASIVILGLIFLSSILSDAGDEIAASGPEYVEKFEALATRVEGYLGDWIMESITNAASDLDIGASIAAAAGQLAGTLATATLVALYLAFLVSERMAWVEKLPRMASSEARAEKTRRILQRVSDGVKQYMWVNVVTSAMSGTVAYVIFTQVGLDFAPLLAVIVFVVGFIPTIGAFIGVTLPSLVALLQFDSLTPFLIVLLGYGLADQVIGNVVQPAMQGKSLNLSTFMVTVSLTFWGMIWGGIGAFLAVPMMVVTMVVCAEIPAMRWCAVLLSSDGLLDRSEKEA